jgi:hypothetical protein
MSAAAFGVAVVTAAGLLALPAGARVADATVAVQVVPRGPGTVSTSIADQTTGSTSCTQNQEPGDCKWTFPQGAAVVLSAKPSPGSTFAGWSTPDCPGTGDCHPTIDADQTIVALFSKLTLTVGTSGAMTGDVITSSPAGISCPPTCSFDFDAKSAVTLTVKTAAGSTLTSFPYGCTSVTGATCTVTMLDDPQSVGVKLNGSPGPQAPAVVNVTVRLGKTGNGTGRISATGIDCGTVCFASLPYGTLARLTALPDAGSGFADWGGICNPDTDTSCSLPIGPITLVRPKFVKLAPPLAVAFTGKTVVPGKKPKLVIRLTSTIATTGTGTLLLHGRQLDRKAVALHAGANALTFGLPAGSARRDTRLVLRLADHSSGTKTLSFRIVVHT